jgi:hypothetical protein
MPSPIPPARSSPSSAGRRCPTKSTSSNNCSPSATPSSSAARWPTRFSSPRARKSARASSSATKSIWPRDLLAKAGGKIKLPVDNVISSQMTDDAKRGSSKATSPRHGRFRHRPQDAGAVQSRNRHGQDDHLERPHGRFREKALRRRHRAIADAVADARPKTAPSRSSAAATAPRPSSRWACPKRSATSAPAAAPAWNSWKRPLFDAGYFGLSRRLGRGQGEFKTCHSDLT